MNSGITLSVEVLVPVQKAWDYWTNLTHIAKWNNIDENWHTPLIEMDFRVGGQFVYRMETKDGSIGFDHRGIYDRIIPFQKIEYTLVDGRRSKIDFLPGEGFVKVTESFQPESDAPRDDQENFCHAILQNFKSYAEVEFLKIAAPEISFINFYKIQIICTPIT